jgi:hypothetical protein
MVLVVKLFLLMDLVVLSFGAAGISTGKAIAMAIVFG